jgi:glycosyltransferase 2 family protein
MLAGSRRGRAGAFTTLHATLRGRSAASHDRHALGAVSLMMISTDTRSNAGTAPDIRRQALIWIIKILVSGGLLYVLLRGVDLARLWQTARTASLVYLAAALLLYLIMIMVASWRWWLLARVQHVRLAFRALMASYLVASFFNNFLPSNIGGDVIRIRDTARPAGSKTLATTIVLVDRGIGLMGLVFVAALGATAAARTSAAIGPIGPGLLWLVLAGSVGVAAPAVMMPAGVASILRPLRALHQEWVEERITRLTQALARFRAAPQALGACFGGAIAVQGLLVLFYAAIATSLHLHITMAHLAIVVPLSFVVQMLPVSVNGFGVREATFVFYFAKLGVPIEGGLALSFIGAVLMMIFSLSGAVAYLTRRR